MVSGEMVSGGSDGNYIDLCLGSVDRHSRALSAIVVTSAALGHASLGEHFPFCGLVAVVVHCQRKQRVKRGRRRIESVEMVSDQGVCGENDH